MLSDTKTLSDVKSKLFNGFSFWGFDSDLAFENTLKDLSGDVYREVMYDKIGEAVYNSLKAKDGSFSLMTDEYIYFGEVYMICYYFMDFKEKTRPKSNVIGSSFSDDGYSQSIQTATGKSEFAERKNSYYAKAQNMFRQAGYGTDNRIGMQNSIHTGDRRDLSPAEIYFMTQRRL